MGLTPELRLILAIFAVYRLARLIALDDGPFFVFKRLQYWVKDKSYDEIDRLGGNIEWVNDKGEINDRWYGKWHSLAEGLSCPYCLGIWFSLPIAWFVIRPQKWADRFLVLISISGAQAFLWGLVSK